MKGLNVLWIALGVWVATACNTAKAQFVSDYLLVGGSGGYSTMTGRSRDMTVTGGGNGGLSVGWEVRRTHLIYRPVCVELQVSSSSCNRRIEVEEVRIKDTQSGDATMHYEMRSRLRERQIWIMPSLGCMVGYSGNNFRNSRIHGAFYALAGVKVSVMAEVRNEVWLDYETTATYDRYIDDYEDMPNHFYQTRHERVRERFGTKVCGMASGELGWELNSGRFDKLKIGAFVDVGFTNVMYGMERRECGPMAENAARLSVHSSYRSEEMEGRFVTPVMAGVKVTYLFNVNIKRNCISKDCVIGYRQHRVSGR